MLKKFLFCMVAFVVASTSYGGERSASGQVQLFATSGVIIAELTGSNSTCGNRYWFVPDSEYKKALFSMLLSAQMSGKRVWVNGLGECRSEYPYHEAYELVNMTIYND